MAHDKTAATGTLTRRFPTAYQMNLLTNMDAAGWPAAGSDKTVFFGTTAESRPFAVINTPAGEVYVTMREDYSFVITHYTLNDLDATSIAGDDLPAELRGPNVAYSTFLAVAGSR